MSSAFARIGGMLAPFSSILVGISNQINLTLVLSCLSVCQSCFVSCLFCFCYCVLGVFLCLFVCFVLFFVLFFVCVLFFGGGWVFICCF